MAVLEPPGRPLSLHRGARLAGGAALVALLAACAGPGRRADDRDGPEPQPPPGLLQVPDAEPVVEPIRQGGPNKPYTVWGQSYVPLAADAPLSERGLASWYGRKFNGKPTASGELYNMYAMTAAHPTLPIPSYARIRNPANGREVIVRINDRGPFKSQRIVDVSYTAALKLGILGATAPVELERITGDEIRAGTWRHAPGPPTTAPDDATRLATVGSTGALTTGALTPQSGDPQRVAAMTPSGDAPRGVLAAPSGDAPRGAGPAPSGDPPRGTAPAQSRDAPTGAAAAPSGDAPRGVATAPSGDAPRGAAAAPSGDAPRDGSSVMPAPGPAVPSRESGRPRTAAPPDAVVLATDRGSALPPPDAATPLAPIADAPSAAAGTAAGRGFWVQLGAFRRHDGAVAFQRQVESRVGGIAPLLTVFGDATLFRLQAGPYARRDDARDVAERLRDMLRLVPVIVERR